MNHLTPTFARSFLLTILLLCFLGLTTESTLMAQDKTAQRNVVLIVGDDHGLDTGSYGNKIVKTPHLDRLADEGTRFKYAFCTTSSCSPSRSAILTGQYNHATGQYGLAHAEHNFGVRPFVQSLPVWLGKAGYRSCAVGKVHVQPQANFQFDQYEASGDLRNTVKLAEAAEAFIKADTKKPFFVYYCPIDPHRAATGYGNEKKQPGIETTRIDPKTVVVPDFLPNETEVREDLAEYYEAIERMDVGIGRLLQALRTTEHEQDTLVIYISDNGIPFPAAKTTLYDAGVHLPMLIRSPDAARKGVVSEAMVSWIDIAPTILDFTKAADAAKLKLPGRSLIPILAEDSPAGWDQIFGSHTFHEVTMYYPMRMIRNRKYKYILNLAHQLPFPFAQDLYASPTWQSTMQRKSPTFGCRTMDALIHHPKHELYDVESDPSEAKNLAEDPKYAAVLADLQQQLKTWQTATKDPWIIKYEHE